MSELLLGDYRVYEKRVEACIKAAEAAERETSKKLLYAANLTGPTSQLKAQALKAVDAGANARCSMCWPAGTMGCMSLTAILPSPSRLQPTLHWRVLLIRRRIMVSRRPYCLVSLYGWLR